MRNGFVRLGVESLERRDTPSVVSDFWDVFTTTPGPALSPSARASGTGPRCSPMRRHCTRTPR